MTEPNVFSAFQLILAALSASRVARELLISECVSTDPSCRGNRGIVAAEALAATAIVTQAQREVVFMLSCWEFSATDFGIRYWACWKMA